MCVCVSVCVCLCVSVCVSVCDCVCDCVCNMYASQLVERIIDIHDQLFAIVVVSSQASVDIHTPCMRFGPIGAQSDHCQLPI